jgi:hypothetical protein
MSKTTLESYSLSDSAIAQIVQLIQMGILTGTDISDQMRTIRLVTGNGNENPTNALVPCPDYLEIFNENLEKMQALETNEQQ